MKINIKYNINLDEFTYDSSLELRLKNYIDKHFSLAYVISEFAPIYLVGGAIRDLICARKPKDMDFVVLGKEHLEQILNVLNDYNIKLNLNKLGGYKFIYEGIEVDLWLTEDLFSSIQYNVDGLFFDLRINSLLSLTFDDFVKNGLRLINPENNIENGRESKLKSFEEEYLNNVDNSLSINDWS